MLVAVGWLMGGYGDDLPKNFERLPLGEDIHEKTGYRCLPLHAWNPGSTIQVEKLPPPK